MWCVCVWGCEVVRVVKESPLFGCLNDNASSANIAATVIAATREKPRDDKDDS